MEAMSPSWTAALRSKRFVAAAALVIAGLAVLWASEAAAAANPAAVRSVSAVNSAAKLKRIKNYWTPQRMRNATPLTATPTRREVARAARATSGTSGRGKVKTVPPTRGHAASRDVDGPIPYANPIINPTIYPYRTQGKVFFTAGGKNYVCSATVVNTPSKRVVFSAGHCVVDERVVSHNFAFVPGYHNGIRPYGTFVATRLYSINGWIQNGNFSYDISAAVLGGPRLVANVVGSRGIRFNLPRQQNFVSFGYPAAYPFNGQKLYSCPSPFRGLDPTTSIPRTQWITCNMTGGSSGGGWIVQGQYLNSVNSYGYKSQPNRMYGPYFGSGAVNLYNGVKNLGP
jgi:V8-like Glu-specific endopeptidase